MQRQELAAWLRLTLTPGIGGETQRKLLAAFGLPEAVFAAGRLAVRAVVGARADRRSRDVRAVVLLRLERRGAAASGALRAPLGLAAVPFGRRELRR